MKVNTIGKATSEVESPLTVLQGNEQRRSGHGMFRILNQSDGDKRIVWDSASLIEINEAKKLFDTLVEDGLVPYVVDAKGNKTTSVMSEFNPQAEEIIFLPMKQLVGG